MRLHGVCHPVLLEGALPRLPRPPVADDIVLPTDAARPAAPMSLEAFEAQAAAARRGDVADAAEPASADAAAAMPQPVDLRVPPGASVAAITGPNTGGKTAALKTLGVSVLMAQAGLYIRLAGDADRESAAEGAPAEPPRVRAAFCARHRARGVLRGQLARQRWMVRMQMAVFSGALADLGDSQSLEHNLSTFSGHMVRVKDILAAADGRSLVLLDELGSGTDPTEGAALAIALLRTFAERVRFP